MNFYLTDSVKTSNILAGLQNPPATGFEITASGWANDQTFQVQATLQPEDRQVTIYTGKYDGRWQVEGIDLLLAPTAAGTPAAGTTAQVNQGVKPVGGNGSGKLVFQTQSGGGIYVINADGTGLRYITNGIDPQLSPDGKQIAFTRWEPEYMLFTINVDGTGERSWARGWRQMKSPTWTADGSSLVFSWQNGGRLDEKNVTINLADAARDGDNPEIPRNARDVEIENGVLKYRIPADAHWSLKQVKLADGQLKDLNAGQYAFSPTGHPAKPNEVIYTFSGSGIANVDATSDNVRPVSNDARDRAPAISSDGSRVAVSYWQDGNWEVYTINIDGSNRQRLTSTPITVIAEQTQLNTEVVYGKERIVPGANLKWNNAAPAWSPDGQQIAFMTDRSGKWEIWIMSADGSNQRPMFSNGALNDLTFNYAGVDERMLSWNK
jgi:dipeptidyl aminopeptidase/acylaminoacyl peptidase